MQTLLIIAGFLILLLNFMDFFHTTLSGNGFWMLSKPLNHALFQFLLKRKNPFTFRYSGLFHILLTTSFWLIMLILGVYLIFISSESMVIHSTTQEPATYLERFYYTCYTISTLGMGDYVPGNGFSQVITGILSFSGFILLTAAMTYLLSVISAVQQKKQLAYYISSLGGNLPSLYQFLNTGKELTNLQTNSSDLRKLIVQNTSSYGYFPMIHYFLSFDSTYSIEVQLARLRETLLVLREQQKPGEQNFLQIEGVLQSIRFYLEMGVQQKKNFELNREELASLRSFWNKQRLPYLDHNDMDEAMNASLRSAGWTWKEVYA